MLAELLVDGDHVDEELWDAFHARRADRARAVVEAYVQLGRWQIDGVHDADTAGLIVGTAKLAAESA